jgi:hypothetical protein
MPGWCSLPSDALSFAERAARLHAVSDAPAFASLVTSASSPLAPTRLTFDRVAEVAGHLGSPSPRFGHDARIERDLTRPEDLDPLELRGSDRSTFRLLDLDVISADFYFLLSRDYLIEP